MRLELQHFNFCHFSFFQCLFSYISSPRRIPRERCKGVHCVDLGESFPTSIYLQKSAWIQPRPALPCRERALTSLPALRAQIPQVGRRNSKISKMRKITTSGLWRIDLELYQPRYKPGRKRSSTPSIGASSCSLADLARKVFGLSGQQQMAGEELF